MAPRVAASTLYGSLNLLVLRALSDGPRHGLDVARRIEDATEDVLRVEEGALYPALHRLERDGLVEAEWGVSERNRRARFYRLTPAGRERLERGVEGWARHARAVSSFLGVSLARDPGREP